MKTVHITMILALLTAHHTIGQNISDFGWLTGHWIGDGFGGISEEIWSPPKGGTMMGSYRHLDKSENVNFYEFMVIVEENDTIKLKLKHFNTDLTG